MGEGLKKNWYQRFENVTRNAAASNTGLSPAYVLYFQTPYPQEYKLTRK
jgi:hypothetical protein